MTKKIAAVKPTKLQHGKWEATLSMIRKVKADVKSLKVRVRILESQRRMK